MAATIATVVAGGAPYSAFMKVSVKASFKEAARSFTINLAAEGGASTAAWVFQCGTPVQILFNGILACDGFVDRYQPELSEHDKAEITVSGRGRGQDFIDSAALHPTGRFKNKTPLEIAQAIDQFGVGVASSLMLDAVPVYQITPGETCFRCVEKLIRDQGAWMVGQADGSIRIARAGEGRHAPLIEGINFKSAKGDHNWAHRHSKVIVRGQRPVDHGAQNLQIEQTAEDGAVKRFRPALIVQDADTDKDRARKRAQHRRDSEAGESLKATTTVQGCQDDGGQLWTPGFLTFFESPFLNIAQDMAIEEAEMKVERDGGSTTELSLVDPSALGGKGRKGGKAGSAWNTDAGDD